MQKTIKLFDEYFQNYLNRGIAGGSDWSNWNYKDDITIVGAYDLFCATGNLFYCDAILSLTKKHIAPDEDSCEYNLDTISAAKTDIILNKLTGEERFKNRLNVKLETLKTYPRTNCGNFWHKNIYPSQVWLDGLYMALPVYMQNPCNAEDTMHQFEVVRQKLFDENTKLYYHAWDEACVQEWANPESGVSPCVWARAEGWFLMALVDTYELMPLAEQRNRLSQLLKEALAGIMPYQDKTSKMFYQLVDLPEEPNNYLETSGSAMIAYSLMKGSRLGMLCADDFNVGAEILQNIALSQLKKVGDKYVLDGICASAGLGAGPDNRKDRDGSIKYYLSEAVIPDNQHGTAACMMAYSEFVYSK